MASECKCVKFHSPANPPTEKHHTPPTSYTLKPGGKRIVVVMCSNAHGINHKLYNLYRAQMPKPGIEPTGASKFSRYHRDIVKLGWAQTDLSAPIPRTLANPNLVPSRDTLAS